MSKVPLGADGELVTAVLLAAGSGTRFGGEKLFQRVDGRPVLAWSLAALEATPEIEDVVLVTSTSNASPARRLVARGGYGKVRFQVVGGSRRQDSVWNGLQLATGARWVLVHDAARPFATVDLIQRCVAAARRVGGAIAAIQVKDTIKVVRPDEVVEVTPPRARLWAAQTPQVFRYDWFVEAYRSNRDRDVTDDAELYERAGRPVAVVSSSDENLKVTTRGDLTFARAIARGRRARVGE